MSYYRQIRSDKHVCCNCEMDVVHISSIKHVHYTHGERISWTMDKRNTLTVYIVPLATRSHYYWHELMVSEKIGLQTCFSCIAWDDSSHLPISGSLCTTLILTCPFSGKCCSLTVHVCCKQLIKWCTTSINIIITCSLWQQGHSE